MPAMVTGNKAGKMADRGFDFYASPYAALPPLLVAEGRKLPRRIWEPAAGNGALVIPLRNRGFYVQATDIHDWGCPDCAGDVDFTAIIGDQYAMQMSSGGSYGIVTNPPFSIIEEFVERAVSFAPYVAVLARLAFLESDRRMKWWKRVGLQRVHVICDRLPMMHRHGYEGPKAENAAMNFSWFVFESDKRPKTAVPLRWWSWKASCKKYPETFEDMPPVATEQMTLFRKEVA